MASLFHLVGSDKKKSYSNNVRVNVNRREIPDPSMPTIVYSYHQYMNLSTQSRWNSYFTIKNALVIILCIGDYNSKLFPDFIDFSKDYFNIIHSFHKCHGYDCIYFNKQNKLVQLDGINPIPMSNWDIDFKLRWISEEINDFLFKVSQVVQNKKSPHYDGLILFVSSHGGPDNVIYDSTGKPISIARIFEYFDNENCFMLGKKPKLYFIDACKGTHSIKTKRDKNIDDDGITDSNSLDNVILDENKADSNTVTMKHGNYFFKDSHCRKIFSNVSTKDYAAVNSDKNGSYLFTSVVKVISNPTTFEKYDLDGIIGLVRKSMQNLIGTYNDEIISDVNSIKNTINFESKKKMISDGDNNNNNEIFKLMSENLRLRKNNVKLDKDNTELGKDFKTLGHLADKLLSNYHKLQSDYDELLLTNKKQSNINQNKDSNISVDSDISTTYGHDQTLQDENRKLKKYIEHLEHEKVKSIQEIAAQMNIMRTIIRDANNV